MEALAQIHLEAVLVREPGLDQLAVVCALVAEVQRLDVETVRELIASRGQPTVPSPNVVTMHLYWSLYLGVLSFWAADASPVQEDTLVVLDQSMRLFVASLSSESKDGREVNDVVDVTPNC